MKDELHNIPFQVEHLVQNMMNKQERSHIRENYRARLKSIRDSIDASIRKYDNEVMMNNSGVKKKRA
jgi:hypothetical protein